LCLQVLAARFSQALQRQNGADPGAGLLDGSTVEALEDVLDAERRVKACLRLSTMLEAEHVVPAAEIEAVLEECDLADEKLEARVTTCLQGNQKQQDTRVGGLSMPQINAFDAAPLHAPRGSTSARRRRTYGPMSARGPKGR